MRYPSAIGALLRLKANCDRAIRDPTTMIHGFGLMAQDPKVGVLKRDYPVLSKLVRSHGQEYDPGDIRRLDSFVQRYFATPRLSDGLEAFVRSEPCDPLDYFSEWAVMSAVVRTDRPTRMLYRGQKAFFVDDSNLDDVILTDDILFCEVADELAAISPQLPSRPELRAFLLWENCD